MNRADRKRLARADEETLVRGLNADSRDSGAALALTRLLHAQFERAKRDKDIDPPLEFLYAKASATIARIDAPNLACGRGCSHCCHTWVSASAPEVLFAAKAIKSRNGSDTIARVRAAFLATRDESFMVRSANPRPCPVLKADMCTSYEARPLVCRFGASSDADICFRAFRQLSREAVPMPLGFQNMRVIFGVAIVAALRRSELPHHYYEYNAALDCALSREDAEAAWLSGEDIFKDVRRDPSDAGAHPQAEFLYRNAFV